MARRITYFVVAGFFLSAGLAAAQPDAEQAAPIVKNHAAALPAGALLQLGKLAGFRYDGRPATATLSADGKLLAAADMRDAISVVNTETGKIVQTIKGNIFAASTGGMTFSADNSTLAIQTFADLTVWDVASGKQLLKVQARGSPGARHLGPSLSADGKIVTATIDRLGKAQAGEIQVIEVATGKQLGTLESIHNYNIRTAIAPDGKTMLSWGQSIGAGADRDAASTIQVWDFTKGTELRKIKLDTPVQAAACAPDGKTIAAAALGTFQLIDLETGKETRRLAGERSVGSVALRFSPGGQQLVAFDANGGLQAWDVADGKRVALVNAPKTQMLAVAFPAKERIVAMGFLAQTLCWWDATDAKASPFEGHLAPIAALAFAGDGKTLISASNDQRLIWWNTATGKETRQLTLATEDRIAPGINRPTSIALAANGKHAATYSTFGVRGAQLWDLKDGRASRDFRLTRTFSPVALAFSTDGMKLAAAGTRTPASVWDVNTGQEVYTLPMAKGLAGQLDTRAAVSPDGKILATHQYDPFEPRPAQNAIVLWDLAEKKELRRINLPAINAGANSTPGMAFSADGKFLAVPDSQGAILLYSTATGREWRKLTSAARMSTSQLAFSADGRFLAAGNSPRIVFGPGAQADDVSIEIWEIASGQTRERFKGHAGAITCLAFSRDDAILASGSMDTTVLFWDVAGKNARVAPFAENEIPAAWKALTGTVESANLSVTMRRLIRSPATVGFLEQNFQPAKKVEFDDKKLAQLVADLDAGDFTKREIAMRDLKLLGARAEAALKKGLADNPSVEARRRIQDLLDAMVRAQATPEELQAIRGVEILERICTPEALDLLIALSQGDPHATATQEATAALKRLPLK